MKKQGPIRTYEIDIAGTRLDDMETEARKQFELAFRGQQWELISVSALLTPIASTPGSDQGQQTTVAANESAGWTPGEWAALYRAQAI